MSVGTDPVQGEVESDAVQLRVVQRRRFLRAELPVDPVQLRRHGQRVEERRADEQVVRPLVVRRDGALVAEPDVRARPARLQPGGELVDGADGRTP